MIEYEFPITKEYLVRNIFTLDDDLSLAPRLKIIISRYIDGVIYEDDILSVNGSKICDVTQPYNEIAECINKAIMKEKARLILIS